MNTETVTSTRTGQVLQVLTATEDDDLSAGWLKVQDADGFIFTIRAKHTTPGGDFTPTAPAADDGTAARELFQAEMAATAELNAKNDRRENRRSYYLRTGK